MSRGIRSLSIALALAGVTIGLGVANAAEDSPLVRLASSGPVNLGTKPGEVVVVNESTTQWTLDLQASVEASAPGAEANAVGSVGVPVSIAVEGAEPADNSKDPTSPVVVPGVNLPAPSPSSDGTVSLVIDLTATREGAGELIVVATPSSNQMSPIVMRQPIVTSTPAAVPAVGSVTGFSADGSPLAHSGPVTASIPLETAGPCPPAKQTPAVATTTPAANPILLGEVTLVDGDHAITAQVGCGTDESTAGGRVAAAQVNATQVPSGGDFKGTLTLGDEEVSVTVSRSDRLLWPVLAMLVGFLVAFWVRLETEERRPVKVVRWRLAQAARAVLSSQARVSQALTANALPTHSMSGPVIGELDALRKRIDNIKRRGRAEELTAIAAAVAAIGGLVDDWESLPKKLLSMDTGRAAVPGLPHIAPNLDDRAAELLDPREPPRDYSSKNARDLLDEVAALEAVFSLIPNILTANQRLDAYPASLPTWDSLLNSARSGRNEITALLKESTAAKPLVADGIASKVEALRTTLRQLPDPRQQQPAPLPPGIDAEVLVDEAQVPPLPEKAPTLEGLLASWNREAEEADFTLDSTDLSLFIVAAAIALWTGLTTNYFGQAWGSPLDYAVLFFWALTGAAVISTLFDAARRFGDREFSTQGLDAK